MSENDDDDDGQNPINQSLSEANKQPGSPVSVCLEATLHWQCPELFNSRDA
jgi:hypothetical protein